MYRVEFLGSAKVVLGADLLNRSLENSEAHCQVCTHSLHDESNEM